MLGFKITAGLVSVSSATTSVTSRLSVVSGDKASSIVASGLATKSSVASGLMKLVSVNSRLGLKLGDSSIGVELAIGVIVGLGEGLELEVCIVTVVSAVISG